ncbi:MAG: hypothetical protein AAF891_07555, partial [Pseudomonadota bacterium]
MTQRATRHELSVDTHLVDFIEKEALPGTGIDADHFWSGLASLAHDLG